jgi:hypothetical protein
MPDQEPFIIPSADPFKVEATPAKFGGVDARAKRPLDMSGKAVSLSDHLEPVRVNIATQENTVALSDAPLSQGEQVSGPQPEPKINALPVGSAPHTTSRVDSKARLPADVHRPQAVDGPVVQDALDTRHRERFDDPSRFVRTDTKVRLPSASPLQRHQALSTAPVETHGRILIPPLAADVADSHPSVLSASSPAVSSVSQPGEGVVPARPDGAQLAAALAALSAPSSLAGTPEQRRQSFNQRLTQILSDQQQIADDLSAVEQAAQLTRAQIHDPPVDGATPSD